MRIAIALTAAAAAVSLVSAPAQAEPAPRAWIGLPTTVTISVPQMYVGIPATVTATITPTNQTGSAAFWANYPQDGIGGSQRVTNGTASVTFTPGTTGWQTIGVSFTPDPQQGTTQGAASAVVNVLPSKGADTLTLSAAPASLAPGAPVAVTATTASGAAATATTSGGCSYAAGQLSATSGTGTCTATFISPGAGAYTASAPQTWTIPLTLGRQTAVVSAPKSGAVPTGKAITLAAKGTKTNAGVAVRWKVTTGASACRIGFTGANVVLRTRAAGTCTVVGTAAAVPGVWGEYRISRTYRIS